MGRWFDLGRQSWRLDVHRRCITLSEAPGWSPFAMNVTFHFSPHLLPPSAPLSLPPFSLSSSLAFSDSSFFLTLPRFSSHYLAFRCISNHSCTTPDCCPPYSPRLAAELHTQGLWHSSARLTRTSGVYSTTTPDFVYSFLFQCIFRRDLLHILWIFEYVCMWFESVGLLWFVFISLNFICVCICQVQYCALSVLCFVELSTISDCVELLFYQGWLCLGLLNV